MRRALARVTTAGLMFGVLTLGAGAAMPATASIAYAAEGGASQSITVQAKARCRVMGPEEWYLITGQMTDYGGMLCVR
jgi:hypothetical protein